MTLLDEAGSAIRSLAQDHGASIVGIGHRWAVGSGIVIARDRILTNAHNIRGEEVGITFDDDRRERGKVLGIDVDGDIAVVEAPTGDARPVDWNGTRQISLGEPVFALANPGGRGLRVSFGFVSGTQRTFRGPRGRRIAGSIEHTAPLLPGSSGGAVVGQDGTLLGVNTNRLGEGFYLAIPADETLKERAEALGEGREPTRPRLGIGVAPGEVARRMRRAVGLEEADGLLVRVVEEGSPAAAAGIEPGDLLAAAGGSPLSTPDDLYDALERTRPGATLELEVVRGVDRRTVTVNL